MALEDKVGFGLVLWEGRAFTWGKDVEAAGRAQWAWLEAVLGESQGQGRGQPASRWNSSTKQQAEAPARTKLLPFAVSQISLPQGLTGLGFSTTVPASPNPGFGDPKK